MRSLSPILALACLMALGPRTVAPFQDPLQAVRDALSGPRKDPEKARTLLLAFVEAGNTAADPLCYAYVYLGYIEDRAGHRDRAIPWFQKASDIAGASAGIRDLAKLGLERPITWIRHLDETASAPAPAAPTKAPERAYVTSQPPASLMPATELTAQQRRDNFEALWRAIDTTYASFDLKSIDWPLVGQRYRRRLDETHSADEFYRLLFEMVGELKDTHSWLQNYRRPMPAEVPGLAIELVEGRAIVVAARSETGVAAGWEVLSVDGLSVAARIEALRRTLPGFSTERAYRREAVRHLLSGPGGTSADVTLRSPDSDTRTLSLARGPGAPVRPPARAFPAELTKLRFIQFARHPSGLGYIRIGSFNSHGEVADEFDRALDALRETPGLILDIRGNPGGFGQGRIVGRLLPKRALVGFAHIKNGPGHADLDRREQYLDPAGPWQYARPTALLIDEETGSAADLFACELRSAGRVVAIGSTTHGNLSGVASFVVLPCGLVVRVSNGYLSDAHDRPIEGRGNVPDIAIAPTVDDVLNGRDPVLVRAVEQLTRRDATSVQRARNRN